MTMCEYQSYKRIDNDDLKPKIFCKKHKELCHGQRYCSQLSKFIISERVNMCCRDFKQVGQ